MQENPQNKAQKIKLRQWINWMWGGNADGLLQKHKQDKNEHVSQDPQTTIKINLKYVLDVNAIEINELTTVWQSP